MLVPDEMAVVVFDGLYAYRASSRRLAKETSVRRGAVPVARAGALRPHGARPAG